MNSPLNVMNSEIIESLEKEKFFMDHILYKYRKRFNGLKKE